VKGIDTETGKTKTILIEAVSVKAGGGRTYLQELFRHYQSQDNVRVVAIVPAESREFFAEIPRREPFRFYRRTGECGSIRKLSC
jgi:hypothetical protein